MGTFKFGEGGNIGLKGLEFGTDWPRKRLGAAELKEDALFFVFHGGASKCGQGNEGIMGRLSYGCLVQCGGLGRLGMQPNA